MADVPVTVIIPDAMVAETKLALEFKFYGTQNIKTNAEVLKATRDWLRAILKETVVHAREEYQKVEDRKKTYLAPEA